MSTDIVDRLRQANNSLCREARDEIERLRGIVAMWEDCAFKTKEIYGGVCVPRTSTYDGGVKRIESGEWSSTPKPHDTERDAVEHAAAGYQSRADSGVGLLDDGPDECREIASALRSLLERLK